MKPLRLFKRKDHRLLWVCILVLLIFALGLPFLTSHQPKIALIMKSLDNEFFADLEQGFSSSSALSDIRARVVVRVPAREEDVNGQIDIVEQQIAEGVDAIVIAPCHSKNIVGVLIRAQERGIKVIIVDTPLDKDVVRYYSHFPPPTICSDNFKIGRLAAEALSSCLTRGDSILLIEGVAGQQTSEERCSAFIAGLNDSSKELIVASRCNANWDLQQSYDVTKSELNSHSGIKGIYAANDVMAIGAARAVEESGRYEIKIVGTDATRLSMQEIQNGKIYATISQDPYQMGEIAAQYAAAAIEGRGPLEDIVVQSKIVKKDGDPPPTIRRLDKVYFPSPINTMLASALRKFREGFAEAGHIPQACFHGAIVLILGFIFSEIGSWILGRWIDSVLKSLLGANVPLVPQQFESVLRLSHHFIDQISHLFVGSMGLLIPLFEIEGSVKGSLGPTILQLYLLLIIAVSFLLVLVSTTRFFSPTEKDLKEAAAERFSWIVTVGRTVMLVNAFILVSIGYMSSV